MKRLQQQDGGRRGGNTEQGLKCCGPRLRQELGGPRSCCFEDSRVRDASLAPLLECPRLTSKRGYRGRKTHQLACLPLSAERHRPASLSSARRRRRQKYCRSREDTHDDPSVVSRSFRVVSSRVRCAEAQDSVWDACYSAHTRRRDRRAEGLRYSIAATLRRRRTVHAPSARFVCAQRGRWV